MKSVNSPFFNVSAHLIESVCTFIMFRAKHLSTFGRNLHHVSSETFIRLCPSPTGNRYFYVVSAHSSSSVSSKFVNSSNSLLPRPSVLSEQRELHDAVASFGLMLGNVDALRHEVVCRCRQGAAMGELFYAVEAVFWHLVRGYEYGLRLPLTPLIESFVVETSLAFL